MAFDLVLKQYLVLRLKCVLLETNNTFVAVYLGRVVIQAVYMPTNYRNEQSNEGFAKACGRVSKFLIK